MTKAKISEYDAVAANNTDVNGVNIAEGCPPSGMNNMGREIMAALKRFQTGADGDSVTVGGSLVVSNTLTAGPVSATTLNTSGAVVFNDAGADVDFRVESDTNTHALFVEGSSGDVLVGQTSSAYSSAGRGLISLNGSSEAMYGFNAGGNFKGYILHDGTNFTQENQTSTGYIRWITNAAERMRITSGGGLYLNYSSRRDTGNDFSQFAQGGVLPVLESYVTNGAFSSAVHQFISARSAASSFVFLHCYSNDAGDVEFNLRGDGNAYADGSWNGSGADYAEYFESAGETIPRGTTVVLDNNKVRAATENDPASSIVGVVRPKEFGKGSMVVGNLAWNMWTDKYLTDDFGVYEMEDHDVVEWEETITDEEGKTSTKSHSYESHAVPEGVTVPADATRKTHDEKGKKFQHRKLNPAWSAEVEYTPREERPEWHIIGLLGQVPVLKGQPVGDRWIKMRDISETVEEWFIR